MRARIHGILFFAITAMSACGDDLVSRGFVESSGPNSAGEVVLDGAPFSGAVLGSAGDLHYCRKNPGQCQ